MKNKTIITLFILVLLTACAGKKKFLKDSIQTGNTKLPAENFKKLFIGSIINQTSEEKMAMDLKENMIDFFSLSTDFQYTGSYNNADLYLSLELSKYLSEEIPVVSSSNCIWKRYFLKLSASVKDIKSNDFYINNKTFKVSVKHLTDLYYIDESIEKAKDKLYSKVTSNVYNLLRYGSIADKSLYGYEGYEEESSALYSTEEQANQQAAGTNTDACFKNGEEELTEEQKREKEIADIDLQGDEALK
ncbi:MAG TPA: hypothetical protein VKS21_04615 [Spirochaetota bacterium]|nr:hypothetical protein [Spirochaetota bacterium]